MIELSICFLRGAYRVYAILFICTAGHKIIFILSYFMRCIQGYIYQSV